MLKRWVEQQQEGEFLQLGEKDEKGVSGRERRLKGVIEERERGRTSDEA